MANVPFDRSNPLNTTTTLYAANLNAMAGLNDPISNQTTRSSLSSISEINPYPPILLDPGNTIATARDLGLVTGIQTINQFVGSSDPVDFYHVTMGISNLNATLTGLSADADLRVIRDLNQNGVLDVGEMLASSTRSGKQDESITLSGLSNGDYFIQVSQYIGDTKYKLQISEGVPNDLLAVETDLGALLGTKTFSGVISNLNTSDDYRFSVTDHVSNGVAYPTSIEINLTEFNNKVDIWLIRDANGNGIMDQNDIMTGSFSGGTIESINQNLYTGTYFLQVSQDIGNTNYHLSISTGDWFSTLHDPGLIAEARYRFLSDHTLGRDDMVALFRAAEDGGVVDAYEFNALQTIVQHASTLGIPDYVEVLANKVLKSNPANTSSGIGNLAPGSSAAQMEKLIGKWFLGSDRAIVRNCDRATTYNYQSVSGALFQNGVSYQDVHQKDVADGYFLSALGAVAAQSPNTISNMFIDNGDNTFTVRFFNQGVADFVIVDRYLPTDATGNAVFAGWGGGKYTNAANELWVALAEKAYTQMNQSGWIGQDNTNAYNGTTTSLIPTFGNNSGINGGLAFNTLAQITGLTAANHSMVKYSFPGGIVYSISDLISAFNAGKVITVNANPAIVPTLGGVSNQVYTLVGYNSVTDHFHVCNPLGNDVELTRQQLINDFNGWDVA
jgi:hypothetical protein